MKVAAIGSGAWGKNIVRTLNEMGALGVIAEASQPLRDQLAVEYPGLELVSNYSDIFTRTDIVAVTIATPVPTHHPIAKDCLLAGQHVFVEKPMTLNSMEAEDLIRTAEECGRILMTGHLLLYKPAIQFIRTYLAAGSLGRVFTYHQERMKLGKARAVENALWSLGVHDVAALLYIAGEAPVKVSSCGHRGLQPGIEDDVHLHMTFGDGRVAHLHNSWLWPEDRRGLTVIGERGMLVYNEKAETVTLVKKRVGQSLENIDEGSDVLFTAPPGFQPLVAELQHFLDCVRTGDRPLTDGVNGLDVIRVLESA